MSGRLNGEYDDDNDDDDNYENGSMNEIMKSKNIYNNV